MKKPRIVDIIIITILAISVLACVVVYLWRFSGELSSEQEIFGQFGEYLGGVVGTLVSLFSLVYIFKTYRKQVDFSEHEIELSYKQQFEASLFSLLQNQRSSLLSLTNGTIKGNDFINKVCEDLQVRLMEREYDLESITYENRFQEEDIVCSIYEQVYNIYGSQLGHYYRNLFHLLSYVEHSDIEDKKQYIDLIQAQLSNAELFVLFYNGISRYGKKKLFPLLEKYGLLENVYYSDFDYFARHQRLFYPETQFKYSLDSISKVVFLGGIHGVGKNTICSIIEQEMDIIHLSASELIKWGEISPDENNKKVKDVDETQNRLISALRGTIEPSKRYVLDGHFCLLRTSGDISRVPFETFRAINPCAIAVMTETPSTIRKRLAARNKKEYSVELLREFQQKEVSWAKDVSAKLNIPFLLIHGNDPKKLQDFIRDCF